MNDTRQWLKDIRISHNLSTYAIAKLADISQSHYSMIENGSRRASVENAKKIAQVLEFDWTRFFDEPVA